jgi:hypothetical protein
METFMPNLMNEVLTDYKTAPSCARDSKVLTVFATAICVFKHRLNADIHRARFQNFGLQKILRSDVWCGVHPKKAKITVPGIAYTSCNTNLLKYPEVIEPGTSEYYSDVWCASKKGKNNGPFQESRISVIQT